MKTISATGVFSLLTLSVISQDTIYTRNGEVIPARVAEINQQEVKYRKPSNPDGPLYVMSKNDIAVVEYKNGNKDVFNAAALQNSNPQNAVTSTPDNSANQGANVQNSNPSIVNNTYYGNSRPGLNVVVAPPPLVIGGGFGYGYPYGMGWGGFYRPYGYWHGGWGGGYGGWGCHRHWHHR